MKEYSIEKVRKFIGKINNGFDYWFTFIINPGVEPTIIEQRERCDPMWF